MRSALFAAVVLSAGSAGAHTREPERTLVVQRDDKGVALLWQMSMLGGPAELLFAANDRDRDGVLSDDEGRRLAAVLLAKAARGIEIVCDGAALPVTALEARPADPAQKRNLVVFALATLGAGACTEQLEVRAARGTVALSVDVQARDGWRLAEPSLGRLAPDRAGLEAPVKVSGGESLRVRTSRPRP
jgi:hypothetical protein